MPSRTDLHGLSVLVTRPAQQAGPLCDRITDAGGRAVRFPLLVIHDLSSTPRVADQLDHLGKYGMAIFISPNAVRLGIQAINHQGGLPSGLKLATVGQGSAVALQQIINRPPDIVPSQRYDSEGLLALPEMRKVEGMRILIFRGQGGRELLADTLRQRGAIVDYVELYRRDCPTADSAEQDWLEKTDIITITSSEALHNLLKLTSGAERKDLLGKPMVVVSERTAELAQELGFHNTVIVAPRADDKTILQVLADWVDRQPMEHQT